ncbi:MAG TPA: aldo/keto reductase [Silvibacterium sp.]|jgi:aryl-alcohol dehydrogenase-like predicted oxidoreductase|nr:aldo/keto reductase [Silvibacterium sp.]
MQSTELGQTGITASVLGFGCSALLGRTGRRDSLAALGAAWDAGISLYDTARAYGYGESEALLGEFLRGRRDKAVISTKFGIVAAPQQFWKRIAKPIGRKVVTLLPTSRRLLSRQAASQFTGNHFTVPILEASIHESLRKLHTDYVDLFFMHAAPASVLDQDDLLAALDKLVTSGKVRATGISADSDVVGLTLRRRPAVLRALQFACNVFDLSAAKLLAASNGEFAAIANHPFGGAARVQQSRAVLLRIAAAADTPAPLREKLGGVDDSVLADVVLNIILGCTGIHAVVPSMMKLDHLNKNVAAVANSRFTLDETSQLKEMLTQGVSLAGSVAN